MKSRAGYQPDVPPAMPATGPMVEPPGKRVGAIALFLLLFISFSRLTDFALAPLHLPLFISVFCMGMAVMSGNLMSAFRSRVGIAFGLLTVWMVMCIPFSYWPGGSFALVSDGWIKAVALFVVAAALIGSVRQGSQAVRVLAWSFFITSLMGFVYGRTIEGRFGLSEGLYRGSNELATAMVQGCIFWLYMVGSPGRSKLKRALSVLPLAPMFIILLNTASRAGIVVLLVVFVALFMRYSMKGRITLIAVASVAAVAAVALAPGSVGKRVSTIFGGNSGAVSADSAPDEAVESSKQRTYLLRRSIELTFQHPILGVGPGQFAVAENGLSAKEGVRGQWLGTHNTYTEISSENGLPGLLLFLATLYYCRKELREAERIHRSVPGPAGEEGLAVAFALRLALISYVVFYCFEHIGYAPFYPAVAGIIVGFARATRQLAARQAPAMRPAGAFIMPAARFGPQPGYQP